MATFWTVKELAEHYGIKKQLCEKWLEKHGVNVRGVSTGKRSVKFVDVDEIVSLCEENKEANEELTLMKLVAEKNKRQPRAKKEDQDQDTEERVVDGVRVAKRRGK